MTRTPSLPALPAAALLLIAAAGAVRAAEPGTLEVRRGSALVRVDAIAADVLRIRVAPTGTLGEDASWSVPAEVHAGRAAAQDVSDAGSAGLRTAAMTVKAARLARGRLPGVAL